MSAQILREAAAKMRDNASKAEPGRWKLWGMQVLADPKGTSDLDDGIHVADAYTPSTAERRLHTGNADHIAAWHPAVALAVADWLDAEADEIPPGATNYRDGLIDDAPAVRVARAYLGTDQ